MAGTRRFWRHFWRICERSLPCRNHPRPLRGTNPETGGTAVFGAQRERRETSAALDSNGRCGGRAEPEGRHRNWSDGSPNAPGLGASDQRTRPAEPVDPVPATPFASAEPDRKPLATPAANPRFEPRFRNQGGNCRRMLRCRKPPDRQIRTHQVNCNPNLGNHSSMTMRVGINTTFELLGRNVRGFAGGHRCRVRSTASP